MQRVFSIAIVLAAAGSARADDGKVRVREVDAGAWPLVTGTEPHVYEVTSDVPIKARLEYLNPAGPRRGDTMRQDVPTVQLQPHRPTWIFATIHANAPAGDCGFDRAPKGVTCVSVTIGSAELGTHGSSTSAIGMTRHQLASASGMGDNGACGVVTAGHKEWTLEPGASVVLLRAADAPSSSARDWSFAAAPCDRFEIMRGGKPVAWGAWQGDAHALRLVLER
jgi:hypothetical protein